MPIKDEVKRREYYKNRQRNKRATEKLSQVAPGSALAAGQASPIASPSASQRHIQTLEELDARIVALMAEIDAHPDGWTNSLTRMAAEFIVKGRDWLNSANVDNPRDALKIQMTGVELMARIRQARPPEDTDGRTREELAEDNRRAYSTAERRAVLRAWRQEDYRNSLVVPGTANSAEELKEIILSTPKPEQKMEHVK